MNQNISDPNQKKRIIKKNHYEDGQLVGQEIREIVTKVITKSDGSQDIYREIRMITKFREKKTGQFMESYGPVLQARFPDIPESEEMITDLAVGIRDHISVYHDEFVHINEVKHRKEDSKIPALV